MSAETALRRMLQDTGLQAMKVGDRSFRLTRKEPPPAPAIFAPAAEDLGDIVVTATKRPVPAPLLAGVETVTMDSPLGLQERSRGPADLAARIPALSSTALGAGRDKLFLRGMADSSFAGATEATLGEYLGEARINFNAPDPGLLLYDVDRIELLNGAQGTLYGGGTLGGVLRIEPRRPDVSSVYGHVDAAASSTRSGEAGGALAAAVNLPLVRGQSGVRLLAYRKRDGGYIDDAGRRLKDVNRSTTWGARAQVRFDVGPWKVDLLGTHQRIGSRDSNYADAKLGTTTRSTSVAQPSSNDFSLLDVEARGPAAGGELVSTTSIGRNILNATYDATARAGAPAPFRDVRGMWTLNHETRLARSTADGAGWVLGYAAFAEHEASEQSTGDPALADLASNFRSDRFNAAIFGQRSLRLGDMLLTGGLRGTYSRQRASTRLQVSDDGFGGRGRNEFNLSPMVEAAWLADARTTLSLSLRQGFRSGGNSIFRVDAGTAGAVAPGFHSIYYRQDLVRVAALEFNRRSGGAKPLDLSAALSAVRWNRTQGTIVDEFGFLYSTNTNGSTLFNLDVSGSWLAAPGLSLRAGGSLSGHVDLGPGTAVAEVPSVPSVGAYASVDWTQAVFGDWLFGAEGRVGYRGRSRLGFGFLHDIEQGDALFTTLAARIGRRGRSISVSIENLTDDDASLFGYGDPFTIRNERQVTPQRPRTISIGFHAEF